MSQLKPILSTQYGVTGIRKSTMLIVQFLIIHKSNVINCMSFIM